MKDREIDAAIVKPQVFKCDPDHAPEVGVTIKDEEGNEFVVVSKDDDRLELQFVERAS